MNTEIKSTPQNKPANHTGSWVRHLNSEMKHQICKNAHPKNCVCVWRIVGWLGVTGWQKVHSHTELRCGCSFYVFLLSNPQFVSFVDTLLLWVISGIIRGRLLNLTIQKLYTQTLRMSVIICSMQTKELYWLCCLLCLAQIPFQFPGLFPCISQRAVVFIL